MNSDDVTKALVKSLNIRSSIIVPNVSWGLVPWGESDVLALSGSSYLTEYEIKISAADIKREWKKERWSYAPYRKGFEEMVKRYYMVVPNKLRDVAEDNMPEDVGGGIIVADYVRPNRLPGTVARCVKEAKINKEARKLTDEERLQLARLGTMRYWSRFLKEE